MIKVEFNEQAFDDFLFENIKNGIKNNIEERLGNIDLKGQELIVKIHGNNYENLQVEVKTDNLTDDLRLEIEQALNVND